GLDDRAAAPFRLEELEAEVLRPARKQRDLALDLGPLLFQWPDLRHLRRRALGEVLLGAEALDETLEAGDVDVVAPRRGRCSGQARGLLPAPVVPGAGEVRRVAGLELEHRRRHGFEEPAV